MMQPGFFDFEDRLYKIDKQGDPLNKINETVDWEIFLPTLEKARDKNRQPNVGAKGYDVILLFKILIISRCIIFLMMRRDSRFLIATP